MARSARMRCEPPRWLERCPTRNCSRAGTGDKLRRSSYAPTLTRPRGQHDGLCRRSDGTRLLSYRKDISMTSETERTIDMAARYDPAEVEARWYEPWERRG